VSNEHASSFEEVLVNRLAHRIGILTAQVEALTIENEQLRGQAPSPIEPDPSLNGEAVLAE